MRLAKDDGHDWFVSMLGGSPVAALGQPNRLLLEGQATQENLLEIKEEGKKLLKTATEAEARLVAVATYFLAVAAALAHYGTLICSRDIRQVRAVLRELEEVAPDPWSELLSRAIHREPISRQSSA